MEEKEIKEVEKTDVQEVADDIQVPEETPEEDLIADESVVVLNVQG